MADTKHIEFLQAAIARMAGHSFTAKGWSITLASAALALAVKDGGPNLALLGLAPLAMFWLLDSYYLGLERSFRALFDEAAARVRDDEPATYRMTIAGGSLLRAIGGLVRPAVAFVHAPLALLLLLVAYCQR